MIFKGNGKQQPAVITDDKNWCYFSLTWTASAFSNVPNCWVIWYKCKAYIIEENGTLHCHFAARKASQTQWSLYMLEHTQIVNGYVFVASKVPLSFANYKLFVSNRNHETII